MKLKKDSIIKILKKNLNLDYNQLIELYKIKSKKKIQKLNDILNHLIKQKIIYKFDERYYIYPWIVDTDLETVLKKNKIDPFFRKSSIEYVKNIVRIDYEQIIDKEKKIRKDFRNLFTITMDGVDAKDFDDAYSLEKRGEYYRLIVHIADVSYYVKSGSPLDKDSLKKGNSYYFTNWVIPMLPFEISNNICSLKEGEDRLTVSVEMYIDNNGKVVKKKFYNSIINVNIRIPYEIGNLILQSDELEEQSNTYKENNFKIEKINNQKVKYKDNEYYRKIIEDRKVFSESKFYNHFYYKFLKLSLELKSILFNKRKKNYSIDFNIPEIKIEFKNNFKIPYKIYKYYRGECEKIIEEFMLITNQTVAAYLKGVGSAIFRIHDKPQNEKKEILFKYLDILGYKIPKKYRQKDIVDLLEKIKNKPEEKLLNTYILRTMAQAEYSEKNIGHFGLAFKDYTHFTSPIRRYSDLIIHRILKARISKKESPYTKEKLKEIAKTISKTERIAIMAERDYFKFKSARYLKQFIKKRFKGIVSGIIEKGIFVEIEENGIEGFVPSIILEREGYRYDESLSCYVNIKDNKDVVSIGSGFIISIYNINEKKGFIDFKIEKRVLL